MYASLLLLRADPIPTLNNASMRTFSRMSGTTPSEVSGARRSAIPNPKESVEQLRLSKEHHEVAPLSRCALALAPLYPPRVR